MVDSSTKLDNGLLRASCMHLTGWPYASISIVVFGAPLSSGKPLEDVSIETANRRLQL